MKQYMGCIPYSEVMDYVQNARTWSTAFGDNGMSAGSGCSGTDIYLTCLECMSEYFSVTHGFSLKVDHKFATEIDPKKQPFIVQEWDTPILVADVAEYKEKSVKNLRTQEQTYLPYVDAYTGGFVCKAISNQNSQRKANKGAVKRADTDTGMTFDAMKHFVGKALLCFA